MAKKKEAAHTLEDRLQAVLVPDWEQPYKVPENWHWVLTKSVTDLYTGNSINERVKAEKYAGKEEGILFITTKDVGFDNIINYDTDVRIPFDEGFKTAPANTALLCIEGGSAGRKCGFTSQEVCFGNKLCAYRVTTIEPKYIFYYLQSNIFNYQFENEKHGLIGGVSVKKLETISLPLPPLPEQQRIVDRIENLFFKLDEAREKAQAALDSFEARKAAILHKVFSGDLTEKWREEHKVNKNSWKEKTLDSVCQSIFDGDHMPPPKADTGIPFIFISNVNTGFLSLENVNHVPEEYYNSLSATRKPQKGDVLYTLVGSYGIPAVVDTNQPFCFQRHMALLKPNNIDTYYLWYVLQTKEIFDKATEIATGTAQLTVPIKGLRRITIPVPIIDEQIEIVHVVDSIRKKEQLAKEAAKATLDQIDVIKKSILARAFRGELGTNDPNDENAVELLKDILSSEPQKKPEILRKKTASIPASILRELSSELEKEIIGLYFRMGVKSLPFADIMAIRSKKFEIIECLRALEQKKIIEKHGSGEYTLLR